MAALFSLALDKVEADFKAVTLVFLVCVLDKGFQVRGLFICHR